MKRQQPPRYRPRVQTLEERSAPSSLQVLHDALVVLPGDPSATGDPALTGPATPGTPGDTPNGGFTGTQTFATANTFAVPEPSGVLAMLVLGAGALCRRARRC